MKVELGRWGHLAAIRMRIKPTQSGAKINRKNQVAVNICESLDRTTSEFLYTWVSKFSS